MLSRRTRWFLFVFFLSFCCLLSGCGAGGGGSRPVGFAEQSPEDAVRAMVADWMRSGGPAVVMPQTTETSGATSSASLGTIRYRDFFTGEEWVFSVDRVSYLSADEADIYASYIYRDLSVGEALIIFRMARTEGVWGLQDITVESLPTALVTAVGIQGFVLDKVTRQPVSGAQVILYLAGDQISSSTTDLQGFYRFTGLASGTYDLVINRRGYRPETIAGIVVQ